LGETRIGGIVTTRTSIYVLRVQDRAVSRLSRGGLDAAPVWSADGRNVLFTRARITRRAPYITVAIWELSTHGGRPRQLTHPSPGTIDAPGALLGDGTLIFTRSIVVMSSLQDTTASVLFARADGSIERSIPEAAVPSPFGSGGRLLITSIRDRNGLITTGEDEQAHAAEIYSIASDGSDARRLTTTSHASETEPSLSPNGDRILYQRNEDVFRTSVWQMNPDGSCQTAILKDTGDTSYFDPAWRPGHSSRSARPLRCARH
jgi:Tol biopolymer transport system component